MTSFRPVEREGGHQIGRRQPVSLMRSNNTKTVENLPVSYVNSGLSLALTSGGMSFSSLVMAPLVFTKLPFETAGAFIRLHQASALINGVQRVASTQSPLRAALVLGGIFLTQLERRRAAGSEQLTGEVRS